MGNPDEQGLEYWLRWQVPVCALIFMAPTVIALILISRVQRAPLSAHDLWLPCWRRLSPIWILIYRAFVFVFMSWLLYQIVALHGAFAFYFYTQWTFTLVIIYFALGTVISAHGCWTCSKKPEYEEGDHLLKRDTEEFNKSKTSTSSRTNKIKGTIKLQSHQEQETEHKAGFWGYLMQAIYQTCAGAVLLTDIVFWFIIVPFLSTETFRLNLLMGCMHTLNVVFLLLDTALNRLPFPWFRFAYFVLWSCIYITFQWVLHACGVTWWPYAFLELSTPWAPLWYFSLAVIHIPCYGIYALIVKAKNATFSKFFPYAYVRPN
ncbi:uncharacterized protein LOC122660336 isoform X2 [Telopea speciosissima]|uniref:uncharacterized protein LOC122660336 isoform X2 n=1 Tax=Telopea speciosissima TaxID=54955 RepID=UPI001CC7171B|nr:uncharacterized protein LOC122660336 isoform X2 [Telopea speciosissima]